MKSVRSLPHGRPGSVREADTEHLDVHCYAPGDVTARKTPLSRSPVVVEHRAAPPRSVTGSAVAATRNKQAARLVNDEVSARAEILSLRDLALVRSGVKALQGQEMIRYLSRRF